MRVVPTEPPRSRRAPQVARGRAPWPAGQRGSVAIIVGLSIAALIGFAGLVVDLGRLYVNHSELQTAADACALAAASELVCDSTAGGTCPTTYLQNATAAGIAVASQNNHDFQSTPVTIAAGDIQFSTAVAPTGAFASQGGGASANSRYAMCIARANGIVPWFMSMVGVGAQIVTAQAVATLASGQTFCTAAPMGLCTAAGSGAPDYGYTVGQWAAEGAAAPGFTWVDYGNNPSAAHINDELAGAPGSEVCTQVGNTVTQVAGANLASTSGYNTRFGIYFNGYTDATAPPDYTGYAYPNQAPGSPVITAGTGSAYPDFLNQQGANTPFTPAQYAGGGTIQGVPDGSGALATAGTQRRLAVVPFVNCAGGGAPPIQDVACVLLVNPMSQGDTAPLYVEYRGMADNPNSPCRSAGMPGGPAANGALVATLVQ